MLDYRFSTILFLLLSVPLVFIAIGCTKNGEPDTPSIFTIPEVLDFGKVRPTDSPVKLTFDICNNGSKRVVITDVIASCGCAAIDIPKEAIPPRGRQQLLLPSTFGDVLEILRMI